MWHRSATPATSPLHGRGSGMCIDSHERVLQQHGVKPETVQAAARVGAIMKAIATVHATL